MNGYTFWEAEIPDQSGMDSTGHDDSEFGEPETDPSEDVPNLQPESLAMGVRDGQLVTGAVRAPEADEVTSTAAVSTMIESKQSGGGVSGPDLLTADDDYESIRSQFGPNPTFLFGAMVDPALVTLSVAMSDIVLGFAGGFAGPAGGGAANAVSVFMEQWLEDLRAGAIGGTVDTGAEETTMKTFLTYTSPDAAKQTGIVQFVNAASNMAESDDFTEMNARYEGESVVVTVTGDSETIFGETENLSEPETDSGTTADLQSPNGGV